MYVNLRLFGYKKSVKKTDAQKIIKGMNMLYMSLLCYLKSLRYFNMYIL
jgi:hypothetical protein